MSRIVSVPVDDLGTPVPLIGAPTRIVSLVPNLSEAMWFWGLGERLVGVTTWCVSPPDGFPNAVRVRGTKNPDVAGIAALSPDVVIANVDENRRLDVDRLRERDVPVYVTAATDVASAAESLARLGTAVGTEAPAGRTADQLMTAVQRHRSTAEGVLPRVAVAIWKDPWMTIGRGTVVGELLVELGFDLVPDEDRYPAVERDDLADVDLLLLPDEPYEWTDEDREELLAEVPGRAVRSFDGQALLWWGPRTPQVVRDLASLRRHISRRAARNARRRDHGTW